MAFMKHLCCLYWTRVVAHSVSLCEIPHGYLSNPLGVRAPSRRTLISTALAASLLMSGAAFAAATGGVITAGSGQITQTGSTTNIRQNSQTLALNWQSFNVAPNETVNFMQPGANSIAINRILSSSPSEIFGHLDANGQVWLINPNGILFGQGAQVNVGGLVASTLDFDNSTLGSSDRNFSGGGKGSVINQGAITAANGGYAALIGNRVSNQGVISAQLGTVALAGGSAATLTFRGDQLLHVQVSQSTLNNLAENKQLIVANGGQVLMTAGAKDAVMASLVNNTGVIQAQSVENHNGTITLLGGMNAGTVDVGGTLDASAPNDGNGGSIETSAAHFNLASNAQITASAPRGSAGTWLIDPTDLTIDAPAATTISTTLNAGTNVTEQTTATGASGIGTQTPGLGDINVNSAVSWTNPAATLTLSAFHAINVNAPVNGAGAVVMDATGGNLTIAAGASVTGGTGLASGTGVTLGAAGNFVNNAGGAAVSTGGAAHWLVYSTNPTLDTAGGLTPGFIQYNAPYATAPDLAAANGFLYSLAPTLNVTGLTGGVTKVYDGTTTAPLTGLNLTTTGLVNGNLISTATGTYASSNAATGLSVTSPGTISAFNITDSTGSIPVFGYALSGTASSKVGSITPAPLTAAIVGDPTNTYDGTVTATLISANYGLSGFVAGQGATVNQPATLAWASADAGPETLNATFVPTNFVANPGTNLANYILPTAATGLGTILQAQLQITGLSASNKVYDATTADPINAGSAALFGVVSTDAGAVTLDTTGAAGNFASPNVGNNLPVTFSGFTLTGARASNYVLVEPSGFTANITPLALTLSGVLAANKVYNATTADTLNVSGATLSGVIPSDASKLSLHRT
jgi:trimeric autotransporter adhesin